FVDGASTASVTDGVLTVVNGSQSQSITLAPDSVDSQFALSSGAGGALTLTVVCFAAGTLIATERGEMAVEDLHIGDRVPTLVGGTLEPSRWIGVRTVDCRRHPRPQCVWPVRISANAFGEGKPARPLLLSPDHAVFIDGVLIPVKYLINGRTIA